MERARREIGDRTESWTDGGHRTESWTDGWGEAVGNDEPGPPAGGFWRGAAETFAIVALFAGVGLAGASLARGAYPHEAMAPDAMDDRPASAEATPPLWLVDGFNVLHAVVLKGRDRREWWRQPARARVLDLAGELPDAEAEIWVVFDGEDPDDAPELPPRVRQVFAPSADDWLVRRVKDTPPGQPVAVVTADRQLAARARHHGAEIVSPRAFAARCRERSSQDPGGATPLGG